MSRKILIMLGLQAFIIVILFWLLVFYGQDEYAAAIGENEEAIETESLLVTDDDEGGAAAIRLTAASQEQSGITTTKLSTAMHQTELASYGRVLSLTSLFELKAAYSAAQAEVNVAKMAIPSSLQQWQRLSTLNRDDKNVSDLAVAKAKATLEANRSRLLSAQTAMNSARTNLKQQWGKVSDNQALINALMQQKLVLLQVTLPSNSLPPSKDSKLTVKPIGNSKQSIKAKYIAQAINADPTIQGQTYIYSAPAENLRSGMRVSALLHSSQQSLSGVIVPDTAVVWYANKAWVYQKDDEELFVRRQINTDIEANNEGDNGWFNHDALKEGDEIVTSGAQLLLSEEFKFQITNENDD